MNYNQKILAHSRGILADKRQANKDLQQTRQKKILSDIPEIENLDREIATRMMDVVKRTVSGKPANVNAAKEAVTDLRMKKAELMTQNGYPVDYLEDIFSCSLCKDSGYINGKVCMCLEKIYKQELTKQLSGLLKTGNECFERFSLDYYSGSDRDHMEKVLLLCKEFSKKFPDVQNLLLTGNPGLGKTFLSACMAREIADRGYSVVYDTAITCLGAFEKQQFYKDFDHDDAVEKVTSMLDCDLMILDDLGTEQTTQSNMSALYHLLNTRLNAGKITVINTNFQLDAIRKKYTPAIASRIEGYFIKIPFVGTDIRQKLKYKGD